MSQVDDSSMYTGIDQIPDLTNPEGRDEETKQLLEAQANLLKELTPNLEAIIDMIEGEIAEVMSIKRFTTCTLTPETDIRSELQASALYEKYLQQLKTKFALALGETRK
jgi:cell division septal protein FtsQ